MGEVVIEKLIQKVSNMLDEIGDVNILIRRLTPTQETLNRIHERVDAVHGVLKQLEKGVQLDEKKLEQLEAQCKLLQEEMQKVKTEEENLVFSFEGSAEGFRMGVNRLEAGIEGLRQQLIRLVDSFASIRATIEEFEQREGKRWVSNGHQMDRLIGEIRVMRWVGMVLAGLTVVCMIVLALR